MPQLTFDNPSAPCSLGLFAGAVAVANIAKIPNAEINWLTSSYLLLRFIFAG